MTSVHYMRMPLAVCQRCGEEMTDAFTDYQLEGKEYSFCHPACYEAMASDPQRKAKLSGQTYRKRMDPVGDEELPGYWKDDADEKTYDAVIEDGPSDISSNADITVKVGVCEPTPMPPVEEVTKVGE